MDSLSRLLQGAILVDTNDKHSNAKIEILIHTLLRLPDQVSLKIAVFILRQKREAIFYLIVTVECHKLIHSYPYINHDNKTAAYNEAKG
jgi:hypothetical protein